MKTWATWAASIRTPHSLLVSPSPWMVAWRAALTTPLRVVLRCSMHSTIVMCDTAWRSSPKQTWVSSVVICAVPLPSVKSNIDAAAAGSSTR